MLVDRGVVHALTRALALGTPFKDSLDDRQREILRCSKDDRRRVFLGGGLAAAFAVVVFRTFPSFHRRSST